jgi:hypothetical protein
MKKEESKSAKNPEISSDFSSSSFEDEKFNDT